MMWARAQWLHRFVPSGLGIVCQASVQLFVAPTADHVRVRFESLVCLGGILARGYASSANQTGWLAAHSVCLRIGMSAARRRRLCGTSRAAGSARESLAIG